MERSAIVSGAGTYGGSGVGNGAAAAIVFAREGAKVVLVDAVRGVGRRDESHHRG